MRAVICGAGIAGLTTAWWLERAGCEVVIVERAPALRGEGYMIDFFASGYDVAERMGVVPRLTDVAYDVDRVSYVDDAGHESAHIDYDQFRRMQHGRVLTLMRGDLEGVLHDALGGQVEVRFDRTIDAVTQDDRSVTMRLSDGAEERADLLIGADGIHSQVRRLVFGPEESFRRYLGYHTAAHVLTDHDLWASLGGRFAMRTVPGHQAGVYPIRDGRVATLYAHRTPDPTLPADPRAALRSRYADLGWCVPEVLAHCPTPPALYYDRVAQIEMPDWSRGRVTLVGDACQAVSLLAGQGASMAMGGGCVLATELAADRDVTAALAAYERRVKPLVERKQRAARRTANWFVPGSQARIRVRDAVLRLATLPAFEWLMRPILTTPGGSLLPDAAADATAA